MKLYTSYLSEENLDKLVKQNYLPIFIIRNLRNSRLVWQYSDSCLHFRTLTPSTDLFQQYKSGLIGIDKYKHEYLLELVDRKLSFTGILEKLTFLNDLVEAKGVVLLGYEVNPELCHRSALSALLSKLWNLEIQELQL